VSSAAYHKKRFDLILMAITSQINSVSSFGEVTITNWQIAGLIKPSTIKPILMTVESSLVIRKLGNLQKDDLQALQDLLSEILGG
jgi:mRNA interferase MazF